MELTNKSTIKSLLKKHGVWAKKFLGQHFLIDRQVLEDILKAADLSKEDLVLEVGPGVGVLTQRLCQEAGGVIAVELDKKFVQILQETCGEFENLEIVNADILKWDLKDSPFRTKDCPFKIVSNIPYQITSHFLRKFLEAENKPKEMVLLVQKEVAERICAVPPDMNLLAVSVQFYAKPEIIRIVKNTSFWPEPEVDSIILRIIAKSQNSDITSEPQKRKEKRLTQIDEKLFFRIVKAGFGEKRKQLINSLSGGLQLPKEKIMELLNKSGIKPTQRAEELSLEDWGRLYENYVASGFNPFQG